MVETSIVIGAFIGVLLFALSLCGQMYQYFTVTRALRITGRLASVEATSSFGIPGEYRDCLAIVRNHFNDVLGDVGLSEPPILAVTIGSAGGLRGLVITVTANSGRVFSPIHFLPTRIRRTSFFPLEDQAACQNISAPSVH